MMQPNAIKHLFLMAVAVPLCALGEPLLDIQRGVPTWDEGIPLGNGQAGALVWGTGDQLNLTLDRADFWYNTDAQCSLSPEFTWTNLVDICRRRDDVARSRIFDDVQGNPSKLPGVRLTLTLAAGQKVCRFRLDRETAAATVGVETPKGVRDIVLWFPDDSPYLAMNVGPDVEIASRAFNRNPSFDRIGGFPEPEITLNESECIYTRKNARHANRFDRDFTAGVRVTAEKPKSAFWTRFWRETARVSLPDPELQRQYDFAIYLYGAGARRGNPPLALQGLWTCDNNDMPPWNGDYHNDLNTEMTYWAAGPAGCIEALEAMADFYLERLPEFKAFARRVYGLDGAAIPPCMGFAGNVITGWTAYCIPVTHGLWAYCTFCDAYDYAPTREKARRYLEFGRELAKTNEKCWTVDAAGVRRMTLSVSPEWNDNRVDSFFKGNTNYDRVILTGFYRRLAAFARVLGETAEAEKWEAYAKSFGPAVVDENGALLIAQDVRMVWSHRHLSHLASVFPFTDVPRDPREDAVKSMDEYRKLGTSWWCGYSFGWSACCSMRIGRGDEALEQLGIFRRAFVTANGFHVNGDQLKRGYSNFTYRPFTLEGNFGFARGVQELMLGYDHAANAVRLFPSWPKAWEGKEASFENLRVPGGHRLSAKRAADGKVTWTLDANPETPDLAPKVIPPASAASVRPAPSPALLERIDAGFEVYGIVHWGINTFADREWGYGDEDPALLNPDAFDADQIVGACRDGGLQGLVVVAKHHDGFCLWPTKTTEHNISKSPFRGGKGDYVKEMSEACRKAGLRFGVYVSPWDRNSAHYATEKYVTDVFQAQIRELLSGEYGEIFEMWFDGANGGDGYYGGKREHRRIARDYYRYETETFAMVRSLQPKICIFSDYDGADCRWPGNETGHLSDDAAATVRACDPQNYMKYCNRGDLRDGTAFQIPECDFPLRGAWFYHANHKGNVLCGEYLMQRYLNTVGNGGTMNVGIAPDNHGRLAPEDVAALRHFGEIRRSFFSQEVTTGEYNVAVLAEDVAKGEFVDSWKLSAGGAVVASGTALGIKRIRVLTAPATVENTVLDYTVLAGSKEFHPVKVRYYRVEPKLLNRVMNATTTNGETDTAKWMLKAAAEQK